MAEDVEFPDISDERKLKVLSALVECKGIISDASQSTQVARSTIYDWIIADPAFKAGVEACREVSVDRVEKKLFDRIDADDTTAIIFFLKTRAKKRGYVERQELTGPDGLPLQVQQITGMVVHDSSKENPNDSGNTRLPLL